MKKDGMKICKLSRNEILVFYNSYVNDTSSICIKVLKNMTSSTKFKIKLVFILKFWIFMYIQKKIYFKALCIK